MIHFITKAKQTEKDLRTRFADDKFAEWEAQRTREARFCRALDKLEAAIAHNESDIGSWLPLEYALNPVYGAEEAAEFPCLARLQARIRRDALKKIGRHTAAERMEGP